MISFVHSKQLREGSCLMAVTSCKIWQKRASFRIDADDTHTVAYRITTDVPSDPVDVRTGAQTITPVGNNVLPLRRQAYPVDAFGIPSDSYVSAIDIRERHPNDFTQWEAVVTYTKLSPTENQPDEDPLIRPVKYQLGFKLISHIIRKDAEGGPIVNTARQPIVDPPRIDFQLPILMATRNYGSLEEIINISQEFQLTANDAEWFGMPRGQAWFEAIRAGEVQRWQNIDYYPATISVVLQTKPASELSIDASQVAIPNLAFEDYSKDPQWVGDLGPLTKIGPDWHINVGTTPDNYLEKRDDTAELRAVIGLDGQPLQGPQYLTENGRWPDRAGDESKVTTLYYKVFPEKDYNELGIGDGTKPLP